RLPPLTSSVNELLNANVLPSSINEWLNVNVLPSFVNELLNANVPQRLPRMPDLPPNAYPPPDAYPAPNKYSPPHAFPSPNTSTPPCPPLHLPGLYNSPDVDVDICDDFGAADNDNDLYSEGAGPFSAPLGNALEHLDGDEMMDHDGDALSRSVWCSEAVQPWGATQSVVGDVLQHLNTLINNSQHYSLIGLPYVAYPADLPAEQHQRFLAKLGAKSEHNRDSKKYEWLHGTREHEASQAAVSHQRLQEQQDAEIRLHETDIQVHEAHSLVLDKEAETLRLKIQFYQMTQGNRTPVSDGAT
ncbi:hypothetical protein BDR05DRAFT_954144, partial [Suillus weaverae]